MAKETVEELKAQLEAALKENKELKSVNSELSAQVVPASGATDLDQYKGKYKEVATGEIYGLKVLDEDQVREKKTHHVKNELHFADYTREEFRARFEKI